MVATASTIVAINSVRSFDTQRPEIFFSAVIGSSHATHIGSSLCLCTLGRRQILAQMALQNLPHRSVCEFVAHRT